MPPKHAAVAAAASSSASSSRALSAAEASGQQEWVVPDLVITDVLLLRVGNILLTMRSVTQHQSHADACDLGLSKLYASSLHSITTLDSIMERTYHESMLQHVDDDEASQGIRREAVWLWQEWRAQIMELAALIARDGAAAYSAKPSVSSPQPTTAPKLPATAASGPMQWVVPELAISSAICSRVIAIICDLCSDLPFYGFELACVGFLLSNGAFLSVAEVDHEIEQIHSNAITAAPSSKPEERQQAGTLIRHKWRTKITELVQLLARDGVAHTVSSTSTAAALLNPPVAAASFSSAASASSQDAAAASPAAAAPSLPLPSSSAADRVERTLTGVGAGLLGGDLAFVMQHSRHGRHSSMQQRIAEVLQDQVQVHAMEQRFRGAKQDLEKLGTKKTLVKTVQLKRKGELALDDQRKQLRAAEDESEQKTEQLSKRVRSSSRTAAAAAPAAAASSAPSGPALVSSAAAFQSAPEDPAKHLHHSEISEQQVLAPPSRLTPRLHQHALESILGFCSADGLSRALQVSKEWNAVVRTMRSVGFALRVDSSDPKLACLFKSPLVRHLGVLDGAVNPALLTQLAQHAPNLSELGGTCPLPPLPASLSLPRKLKAAKFMLTNCVEPIHALFKALNHLTCIEAVTLDFDPITFATQPLSPDVLASIDFSLLHPPSLRSLSLLAGRRMRFTDEQLNSFRNPFFSSLDSFRIPAIADRLLYLVRAPHTLRWKEIAGLPQHFGLIDDDAAVLTNLAGSLTKLSLWAPHSISFLSQLRCLTDLALSVRHVHVTAWIIPAETVLAAFDCPLLTKLHLQAPFTSEHMASLLPRVPLLTDLTLEGMSELESMSFLLQCTAAQGTLHALMVVDCHHVALHTYELFRLFSLRALTSLDLQGSFSEPLDDFGRALFQPPSQAFPLLMRFRYNYHCADTVSEYGAEGEDEEEEEEKKEEEDDEEHEEHESEQQE